MVVTHLHPAPQGAQPVGTTPFSRGHPLALGVRPSLSDPTSIDVRCSFRWGDENEEGDRVSILFRLFLISATCSDGELA